MCSICGNNNCNNCMTSLLNNQESIIPDPLCTPECPSIVGCDTPVFSNCVYWTGGNLNCSNVAPNDTLTVVINKLNAQICNVNPTNCTVAISPPSGITTTTQFIPGDNCCGYLWNKIQTVTLSKTVNNPGNSGCLSLEIDDQPWVWTTPNVTSPFTTNFTLNLPGGIAPNPVQWAIRNNYPKTANLLEVRFQGQVQVFVPTSGLINRTVFQILPLPNAPSTPKFYTGTVLGPGGVVVNYSILINTIGYVTINATTALSSCYGGSGTGPALPSLTCGYSSTNVIISFDGLSYIK